MPGELPQVFIPTATKLAEVRALARRQSAVVTREQLLRLGASSSLITSWVRHGHLHPRYPGVYALGRADLPPRGRMVAALFHAAPGAALDGHTALHVLGVEPTLPSELEVVSPRRVRSYPGDLKAYQRAHITRRTVDRLPVVLAPDAVLRVAPGQSVEELRYLLAQLDFRRLIDLRAFEGCLRRGRPGAAALREALRRHQPALALTSSELERLGLRMIETNDLPMPEVNGRVGRLRGDFVWREQKVIAEFDGLDNHRSRAQLDRDHRRDAWLRSQGWIVLRYSAAQLREHPARIAAEIAGVLAARARLSAA